MAESDPAKSHRTEELIRELNASRAAMSRDAAVIADRANVVHRLHENIRNNSLLWLGGALALGMILAKLPARRQSRRAPKSTEAEVVESARKFALIPAALAALKFALPILRPVVMSYLADRLEKKAQHFYPPTRK